MWKPKLLTFMFRILHKKYIIIISIQLRKKNDVNMYSCSQYVEAERFKPRTKLQANNEQYAML
jgi:hypothetical protein